MPPSASTRRRRSCAGRIVRIAACSAIALLASAAARADLLTDPRFEVGAKRRLARFIGRGADRAEAEAIFHRLPDLEPARWVAEWTRLAEPWENWLRAQLVR